LAAFVSSDAVLAGWGGVGEEAGTQHPAMAKNAIAITNASRL